MVTEWKEYWIKLSYILLATIYVSVGFMYYHYNGIDYKVILCFIFYALSSYFACFFKSKEKK